MDDFNPGTLIEEVETPRLDIAPEGLFGSSLAPITRLAGGANLEGLIDSLRRDKAAHLHGATSEGISIHETDFFRDPRSFEMLRRDVIPRLIEQRRNQRRLRIWSAATSTGQEAYSLAMLLREHFAELADWDVQIVATDVSRRVIAYALQGLYKTQEVKQGLPAELLTKYFDADAGDWVIADKIRAMCQFQCSNLCVASAKLPVFDLVLMRNVLLYCAPQERGKVFHDVYRQMAPDGYLLLGDSEQAEDSTNLFHCDWVSDCYFYRPAATS